MEATLTAKDWEDTERWAMALEDYTRQEPLPWADFFIAQGRARAAIGRGQRTPTATAHLIRLRDEARQARLGLSLRVLEAAISRIAHEGGTTVGDRD